jgi:7-cyano-7-deazaguanine reductase
MKDKTDHLKQLGSKQTHYQLDEPTPDILESFPNQYPNRPYQIELVFNEMTSLCPRTNQPDFANITVEYVPDKLCIESKSFKMYMFAYRNYGSFMETITNKILEDLASICQPRSMKVRAKFNARGGIFINVTATYYPDA